MISALLPVVSPPSNTRPALELQAECPTLAVIVKSRVLQTFQDLSRHVDLCGVLVILIRIYKYFGAPAEWREATPTEQVTTVGVAVTVQW